MKRPTPFLAVAAVSLALLTGCGKDAKSGSPCRDAYVEKINEALTALEKAEPGTDFNAALGDALDDKPKDCEDLAPGLVDAIIGQVLDEQSERISQIEGKFPAPTDEPDPEESEGPSDEESADPSAEESESPSPDPDESSSDESPSPEPSD
jgi:hypothetical protein